MSRTYHHGNRAKRKLFGDWLASHEATPPKKSKRSNIWQWQNTPGWWVRVMMTAPQRAKTRTLLRSLHNLVDLETHSEFPLSKKPHLYYW